MKSPKSTALQDAQAKKKAGGQTVKKESKASSANESSKSQDIRSQGSDTHGQSRVRTNGKSNLFLNSDWLKNQARSCVPRSQYGHIALTEKLRENHFKFASFLLTVRS